MAITHNQLDHRLEKKQGRTSHSIVKFEKYNANFLSASRNSVVENK